MNRVPSPIGRIAPAFSLIAWTALDLRLSEAETVRFNVKELENQEASWTIRLTEPMPLKVPGCLN